MFQANKKLILFFLFISCFFCLIFLWFHADNYYKDYEAFFSKIYSYNFGNDSKPVRYDNYSPQGLILYEVLLGALYNLKPNAFWWDYTMLFITFISLYHLHTILTSFETKSYFFFYLLVYFIIFYWIVRLQNVTHFTYLICFTSFANLTNSNTVNFKTILFYAASFLLGMLLRWEVGVISFLISMAFFILYTPKNQWIKSVPIAIVVVLVSVYALFSFLRGKEFHNQIEPDGEYIVLYEKALRLPPHATALDSLKYEMLNNWIVDDTTLISIDYFKEALAYAKSFRNKDYYFNKIKGGWSRFQEHLKKRWYMLLFFFFLALYLIYYQKDYRFLFFLLIVYGLIFFIAYKALLTERHYFSIIGGVFILSLLIVEKSKINSTYIVLTSLFISVGAFLETNNSIKMMEKQQVDNEKYHIEIEKVFSKNKVFVDAQYPVLFNLKTFKNTSFQNEYVVISFQQHSSSNFFQSMIKEKLNITEYNICSMFDKISKVEDAVVLMSYRRKKTFEKIFNHCQLGVYFEEYKKLSNDLDTINTFGTPVFWKLKAQE